MEAVEAVPVDVALGSFRVDVLTVSKVETAVIVLGVVSAVCSGSSVVSCQFQIDIPPFQQLGVGKTQQRSCWICRRFAPDNTQ